MYQDFERAPIYWNGFRVQQVVKSIRSSLPEVISKKGVLKNFAKFTGKHLCQNLFFNKVAGLRQTN